MGPTTVVKPSGPAEIPGQEMTHALAPRHMHAAIQGHHVGSAYTLDELYRLAQVCQASGLFEDISDASQALVKIMKGQELGLPPMAAMGAFDLIKKRLFFKPWAIAAKINASGYGYFVVAAQDAEHCTIVFSRKYPGKGWVDCVPVTYTIQEAKGHGLVERSAHWKASPAHMLYQRALGRGAAMYFPELLAGLDPPQDDTPIAPERHAKNVTDLFGDGGDGYGQQRGEVPVSHQTEGPRPQEASTSQDPARDPQRRAPQRDGMAWDTLRLYQGDARLPDGILESIDSALTAMIPLSETEALTLAGAVTDWINKEPNEE
jgi:hypothetical protein